MKTKIIKISALASSILFASLPLFVFAATGIENPLGVNDIPTFVSTVLGYVVKVGGVVAIFAFIWSGYLFVEAQGNPEKLKVARATFTGTCIGVAVLLGAQLLASVIVGTLNSLKN